MANCMYCKAEIPEGSTFCPQCGKKQVQIYTRTFRRENMSEDQFIEQINQWFAQYPKIANVKGRFLTNSKFGVMVNKYTLDAFAIEYELFKGDNENQYALVALSTTALIKTPTDTLLNKWKQSNPGAVVLSRDGGVHQCGQRGSLILGGIGAVNKTQLYVFFKFNREKGPGVPNAD